MAKHASSEPNPNAPAVGPGLSRRQFLQVSGAGSLLAIGFLASGCDDPTTAPGPDGGPPDASQPDADAGVEPPPFVWDLQHARHRREAIDTELTGWPRFASAAAPAPAPVYDYQLCERGCAAQLHDHD